MSIFLYFHCIACLSFAGTIVKVTPKKGKAKSLKATITVKNPALSLKAADVVAVGATQQITATVKPAGTKVTYTSDKTGHSFLVDNPGHSSDLLWNRDSDVWNKS